MKHHRGSVLLEVDGASIPYSYVQSRVYMAIPSDIYIYIMYTMRIHGKY